MSDSFRVFKCLLFFVVLKKKSEERGNLNNRHDISVEYRNKNV